MKKQSPVGRIWELGKQEHGKLIAAVVLAVVGVTCGMIPYFSAAKIIVLLIRGEMGFSAYIPWLIAVLVGFLARTLRQIQPSPTFFGASILAVSAMK